MSKRLCEGKERGFDSCVYLRSAAGMSTACRHLMGKSAGFVRYGLDWILDTPIYRCQEGKTGISSCKQTRIRFPCKLVHSPLRTLTLLLVFSSPSSPLDPTRLDADFGVLCPPADSPTPHSSCASSVAYQCCTFSSAPHYPPHTTADSRRLDVSSALPHKLQVTVSFSLPP